MRMKTKTNDTKKLCSRFQHSAYRWTKNALIGKYVFELGRFEWISNSNFNVQCCGKFLWWEPILATPAPRLCVNCECLLFGEWKLNVFWNDKKSFTFRRLQSERMDDPIPPPPSQLSVAFTICLVFGWKLSNYTSIHWYTFVLQTRHRWQNNGNE